MKLLLRTCDANNGKPAPKAERTIVFAASAVEALQR